MSIKAFSWQSSLNTHFLFYSQQNYVRKSNEADISYFYHEKKTIRYPSCTIQAFLSLFFRYNFTI